MKNLLLLVFVFLFAFGASAQNAKEYDDPKSSELIPVRQLFRAPLFRCLVEPDIINSLSDLKKVTDGKDCRDLDELFSVDFDKHSLITYQIFGDCRVSAEVEVRRNSEMKTYWVMITEFYGGCRAAGRFQGWIVVEKIAADYKAVFSVTRKDKSNGSGIFPNYINPKK